MISRRCLIRSYLNPVCGVLALAWVAAPAVCLMASDASAQRPPNVVLIIGDDVGYGDVGVYGSKLIPTPNIDRLANEGIRFTDGHCTSSTCSPSRFALLSGVHEFRHGIGILSPTAPLCIPTDIMTMPKMFQKAGYKTAAIGKWHLGIGAKGETVDWNGVVTPGPLEIGFDESFILPTTNDRVPCVYLEGHHVVGLDPADPIAIHSTQPVKPSTETESSTTYPNGHKNPELMTAYNAADGHSDTVINGIGRIGYMVGGKSALWKDEDMADVLMDRTKKFLGENKEKPFFLYFASQDIHVPRFPHERFRGKTSLTYRGDAMVQLDWSVGEIVRTLETMGLSDNTIIIFSSDNGPTYHDGYDDGTEVKGSKGEVDRGHDGSGIYSGGKYQILEGGTRVPFIIRWPGKIEPGSVSDALVSQIDLMASFAKVLGVPLAANEGKDSRESLDAFLGKDPKGQEFIVEYSRGQLALRRGPWKYTAAPKDKKRVMDKEAELFNVAQDPGEKFDVIENHTELASSMAKELKALSASDAQLRHSAPTQNDN